MMTQRKEGNINYFMMNSNQNPLVMNDSNIWVSDSSSDTSGSIIIRLESEGDANVSDDNADEEDMYENNMVIDYNFNSHLESGGTKIKNSF